MSPQSAAAASDAVSVIMPVLNEAEYLTEAVHAVLNQTWSGQLEVVLALGPSTDDTNQVASELRAADDRVVLVDNPTGRTPDGLNAALAAVRYDVIVRVDGHAMLPPDYIQIAVETLQRTGADNVGGVMAARGRTPYERAVACAMTSRIGVGNASFHTGGAEGEVETVYLGVFRRSALDRVGGYDSEFDRAQDWEMNYRIRSTGGLVWFTPRLEVEYRPRSSARRLARQYFDYGRWRREVMREHPETVSARYLAAPIAVTGLVVGTAAFVVGSTVPAVRFLQVGALAPIGYAALVALGGIAASKGETWPVRARVPAVLATMHVSWGVGFLSSRGGLRKAKIDKSNG